MGGLVILHALLQLERDQPQLLKEADLKVITYATPYLGVHNTDALVLLCDNKQANDMRVLNDDLEQLGREWAARFNQRPGAGVRDTPQVPLYAFRGTADRFVSPASACGFSQFPCETVDGDHVSIVKPTSRGHLSYEKLRRLISESNVISTSREKIGIGVAKLTGDDSKSSAQRSIARNLEFFMSQEETEIQRKVEIRELHFEPRGHTFEEKEAEVKRFGQEQSAAIVVWGEVTRMAGIEEFHPRVTVVKPLDVSTRTSILTPITDTPNRERVSLPSSTVPSEPIKEPIQLVRLLTALTFMEQNHLDEAAVQFEKYITSGLAMAVKSASVYHYAGIVHEASNPSERSIRKASLEKARNSYEKASEGYRADKSTIGYSHVQRRLGRVYALLALEEVSPKENFALSIQALNQSVMNHPEDGTCRCQSGVTYTLGIVHRSLATLGVEPNDNFSKSIDALNKVVQASKEGQSWQAYAEAEDGLADTYLSMVEMNILRPENTRRAVEALAEAIQHKEQMPETWLADVKLKLGKAHLLLSDLGVEKDENLSLSLTAFAEAGRLFENQNRLPEYAATEMVLGLFYLEYPKRETAATESLLRSIRTFKHAKQLYDDQQNFVGYAHAEHMLGEVYFALSEQGTMPNENLVDSITALTKAGQLFKKQQNWQQYAKTNLFLGKAYQAMVKRKVAPDKNLESSKDAYLEAAAVSKDRQDWTSYSDAALELGGIYQQLADHGVTPGQNLVYSKKSLLEAERHKELHGWGWYAALTFTLGDTYRGLAQQGIEKDESLVSSVTSLTKAVGLYKEHQALGGSASAQMSLALAYHDLAIHGSSPSENISNGTNLLIESAPYFKSKKDCACYAKVQNALAQNYRWLAEHGVDPSQNLMRSIDALREAALNYKEIHDYEKYLGSLNRLVQIHQEMVDQGVESEWNSARRAEVLAELSAHKTQ